MNDNNDRSDNRWLTVAEAAQEFSVSERTLQRRINAGKVTSKLEGGRRLLLASSVAEVGGIVGDMSPSVAEVLQEENAELKSKVATLEEEQRQHSDKQRQQMAELSEELQEAQKRGILADELSQDKEQLQQQLAEKDRQIESLQIQLQDASQRHDTVVMQITKMLEYERQPFWRRWFKHKALPAPGGVMDMEPDIEEAGTPEGE